MSNPFLQPGSLLVEQERRRREKLKLGVYVALSGMVVLLVGLLIQGCQRSQAADTAGKLASSALETNSAVATPSPEVTAETNSALSSVPAKAPAAPAAGPAATEATPVPAVVPDTHSAASSAPASPKADYVIKSGDTLGRIAKTHHTTVQALKAANGLKNDRIVAGQKLKLP